MPNQHREKSLPLIKKSHHKSKSIIPDVTLNSSETEHVQKPKKIKSGLMLKKVYNVENVEIEKPNSARKVKQEKSKTNESKYQKKNDTQKRDREKLKNRSQDKALDQQKRKQNKLNKNRSQERVDKLQRKNSEKSYVGSKRRHDQQSSKGSSDHDDNIENRLSTKIWHIMNRNYDDKLYSKLHASDSETKKHIISVIKKYNAKELKSLNRPRETQTSRESLSSGNRKKAIKRRVRKQLWYLLKNAIKNNEHWSAFLAENNIVVDNINIDKFDLSLIDVDALGIENKLLKRTIVWLFK